jgi:hypothetical protein
MTVSKTVELANLRLGDSDNDFQLTTTRDEMLLISVLDNFLTLTNYYNTSDFSATQETWFKTTMEVCLKGLGLSPQPKTEKIVVRSQMMAGSRIIDNTIMGGPIFCVRSCE